MTTMTTGMTTGATGSFSRVGATAVAFAAFCLALASFSSDAGARIRDAAFSQVGITGTTIREDARTPASGGDSGIVTEDLGSEPRPGAVPTGTSGGSGPASDAGSGQTPAAGSSAGSPPGNPPADAATGAPSDAATGTAGTGLSGPGAAGTAPGTAAGTAPGTAAGTAPGTGSGTTSGGFGDSIFDIPRNYVGDPFSPMGILKVCGAFVLVILALLIFLKILGRFARGKSFRGGKEFVLKATMSMDSKKYLAAVEIDGRLLILAVAGDRVTPLAHWASREPAGFGDDLDVGALDLESRGDKGANVAGPAAPTGASVSFEKHLTAKKDDGLPSRAKLKEPAFYGGLTEDEAANPDGKDFNLGIDETGFEGIGINDDDFPGLDPADIKPGAKPRGKGDL